MVVLVRWGKLKRGVFVGITKLWAIRVHYGTVEVLTYCHILDTCLGYGKGIEKLVEILLQI